MLIKLRPARSQKRNENGKRDKGENAYVKKMGQRAYIEMCLSHAPSLTGQRAETPALCSRKQR